MSDYKSNLLNSSSAKKSDELSPSLDLMLVTTLWKRGHHLGSKFVSTRSRRQMPVAELRSLI